MLLLIACVSQSVAVDAKPAQPIAYSGDTAPDDTLPDTGTVVDTGTAEDSAEDTAADTAPADTADSADVFTCDVIDIIPAEGDTSVSRVGETLTLWLWCDDTILLGTQRILLTPPEAGTLDGNAVRWNEPGSVDVLMQSGAYRTTETFTIDG